MKIEEILHKNKLNHWEYDIEKLKVFVEEESKKYVGKGELCKAMGVYTDFLNNVEKKNNIKFNYNFNVGKFNPDFKAIYQDYNWCYQKYIIERKTYQEMADELGCSKRVIEKWCCERHQLNKHTMRKYLKLNTTQRKLITVSLLGDGHIDKRENQPIFIVSHAENQKEYLYWKYNILKDLCNKEPSIVNGKAKDFNGEYYFCQTQYRINTKIIDELAEIRNMTKQEIIKQLDKFQLSIFFLDDGYRSNSNWELCFATFNVNEKSLFIDMLKDKFGLVGKIKKDVRYFELNSDSSRKLDDIILKNIPNDLDIIKYKIIDNYITSPSEYVYVIDENKNKIGISAYFKHLHKGNYIPIREYLIEHDIHEIKYNELDKLQTTIGG